MSSPLKSSLFVLALALGLASAAQADEKPAGLCAELPALLKQAYPTAQTDGDGLTLAGDYTQSITPDTIACKAWPAKPELTLLAVPLLEATPVTDGEVRGDIEVIVADSKTGKPLARRLEKGMAFGDAVTFDGVELDTARYDLKPGLRAFGLRIAHAGSSRVNPYTERNLFLYTLADDTLSQVLGGLIVHSYNGENDGNCNGTGDTAVRTIALLGPGKNGYRDMRVDEVKTAETNKATADDCKTTEKPGKARSYVLRFDGQAYQAAKGDKDSLFDPAE